MRVATPSSTVTSMAQVSGQSCGQATRTVSLIASFYVEQLDPVAHRRACRTLQMRETTDVRGGNDIRSAGLERRELAAAQLARDRGLQKRIGTGGAAANVPVIHRRQPVPRPHQQRLALPAQRVA